MSYFLFVVPSRLFGASRTLDLFGLFDDYNISLNPAQADWLGLQDDAQKVYNDFWVAFEETAKEANIHNPDCEKEPAETEELSLAR